MSLWDEGARNREFLNMVLKGGDDIEQLDRWNKARYRFFVMALMRRYEVACLQLQFGNIPNQDWENLFGSEDNTAFSAPGARPARGLIRGRIGPKFRAVIDGIVEVENQKAKAALPSPLHRGQSARRKNDPELGQHGSVFL